MLSLALILCSAGFAQKTAFVNTETIFKSMPEYTKALETVDKMAASAQQTIDDEFAVIDKLYNDYQRVKGSLNESSRMRREQEIIDREETITKYQKDVFGPEGDIMKKRVELIKPIQDRVFAMIDLIAKAKNYDMVIDIAANPSIVYKNPMLDISQEIISALTRK